MANIPTNSWGSIGSSYGTIFNPFNPFNQDIYETNLDNDATNGLHMYTYYIEKKSPRGRIRIFEAYIICLMLFHCSHVFDFPNYNGCYIWYVKEIGKLIFGKFEIHLLTDHSLFYFCQTYQHKFIFQMFIVNELFYTLKQKYLKSEYTNYL